MFLPPTTIWNVRLFLVSGILLALTLLSGPAAAGAHPLRIGVTPVFLDDQTSFLRDWQNYLEQRLQRPVTFVQRASYREVIELTLEGEVDLAWVCGYPYVSLREQLLLVAVPLFRKEPLYQSYLIVPASDRTTGGILDLRDKIFAYSDPDSNSGFLVPRHAIREDGQDPDAFFKRTFFAWAHRNVVEAVAARIADAGAVDGYVWETLAELNPQLTEQTRVVAKSERFGFPPIVAGLEASPADVQNVQAVLLGMHEDPQGTELLRRLNLDGFVAGDDRLFEGIAAMANRLDR
jgi:phosphonate transport system substrate-binding protein